MPYHLLKNVYTKRLLPCLLLGILLALPGTSSAEAVTTNILQPTKEQKKVSIDIVDLLENNHYSKPILNNRRSELIYSSYLKNLDPSHSYFTAIDVAGFDKWRDQFDDFLKEGKLQPGFTIYKRFLQRVEERLHYTIAQLNRGIETINFTTNETLLLDREKASWPKNTAALDNLWHKQLKDEILRQKLAGKNSIEIEKLLTKRYKRNLVRLKQTMTEDVFQSYMNAYVMSTDPHSSYLSPDSAANFDINMSLSLEGIGALLQNDNDNVKIVRLIPAGPAEKSKLLAPADKIIGVGQGKSGDIVDIVGWRLDEVVKLIRGPKNSVVRLEIIPASNAPNDLSSKVISITRDAVKLEDQAASKSILHIVKNHKSSKIGVITIPIFYLDFKAYRAGNPNYKSTTRDVKKLIKELKAQHVDGIVIDLRNNGGGSLQEVTDLTGLFIKKGPAVVVRNSNGRDDLLTNKDNKIYYNGPMVVLVNRLSASASEIFAGAMQDYHRALIVGSQTFGKGTVQTIQPLDSGELKLTIAKFYRVSGKSTQNQGVLPDIKYPAVVDKTEIGESALPEALRWDTISPVIKPVFNPFTPYLQRLRAEHKLRTAKNPDFIFANQRLDLMSELRKKLRISLNEKQRHKYHDEIQAQQLLIQNKKRIAKGKSELKSLDDIPKPKIGNDKKKKPQDDAYLKESGEILTDYIKLKSQ